jgi:hypothetical protein
MDTDEPRVRKRKIAAALLMDTRVSSSHGGCAAEVAMPSSWAARGLDGDQPRRVDVAVSKTLQAIVDHQLLGMRRAKKIDDAGSRAAYDRLVAHKCTPEHVEAQAAEELCRTINYRSDTPYHASARLNGLGWSVLHIEEHMKRFLESKVGRMMSILRSEAPQAEPEPNAWLMNLSKAQERTRLSKMSYGGEGL